MARRPKLPDLVGPAELQAIFGVSYRRVSDMRKDPGFPAPVLELQMGPIWLKSEIVAYRDSIQERRAKHSAKPAAPAAT